MTATVLKARNTLATSPKRSAMERRRLCFIGTSDL
jgi:hypothetical protein